MTNAKVSMLAQQVQVAGKNFIDILEGVSAEVAHRQPNGRSNSIAATIGHVFVSADGVVNGMLKQDRPLFTTMPTGLSQLPPSGADTFNWYAWGTKVEVDLATAIKYGRKVFASFEAYFATLSDDDLDQDVQTPVGSRSLFFMLNGAVLNNIILLSALKGLHSLKGYIL